LNLPTVAKTHRHSTHSVNQFSRDVVNEYLILLTFLDSGGFWQRGFERIGRDWAGAQTGGGYLYEHRRQHGVGEPT
jgi:hypothetical protein